MLHNVGWISGRNHSTRYVLAPSFYLPKLGGTITQIFRNNEKRVLVVQGIIDRIKWSLPGTVYESSPETAAELRDVIEIKIPNGFSVDDLGIVERFSKGRALLSFPNA